MKKILLTSLLIIGIFQCNAQSYLPIIDTASLWTTHKVNCHPCTFTYFYYEIMDTITIDGKLYHNTGGYLTSGWPLREDNAGKVYAYKDSTEYLLYDFGMQVGDSILTQETFQDTAYHTLDSIDTVVLGGVSRRRYHFSPNNLNNLNNHLIQQNQWIEGIGDVSQGLFYRFQFSFFETTFHSECYRNSSSPLMGACAPVGIPEKVKSEEALKVFPNPTAANSLLEISGNNIPEKGMLNFYDITGQFVKSESFQANHPVSTSGLKAGTYLLLFSNSPQFSPQRLVIQ